VSDPDARRGAVGRNALQGLMPPFHLAFPVKDLESTRAFYEGVLGARVGRVSDHWIDFDFWGHQISAHVTEIAPENTTSEVDGHAVPLRHFGVVLPWDEWHALADRLKGHTEFLLSPRVRFLGAPGEQATLFIRDPSGNALEFKSFRYPERLFAS
jgi:extradiol dioxygenase family protein